MAGLRSYLISYYIVAAISGCLAATVVVVNGTASHAIPKTLCKLSIRVCCECSPNRSLSWTDVRGMWHCWQLALDCRHQLGL